MLNVLDDCDRRGARHPSRVLIRKLPMMRHRYLSDVTSLQLFATDVSRMLRCLSPLTLDHQRTQSESSPFHRHLYALVDGCWLGIRTLVRISGPKPKTPSYSRSPCWPWPQEGRHTEIGGSVPESKCWLSRQPLSVEANVGTLGEVVTLVSVAGVLTVS